MNISLRIVHFIEIESIKKNYFEKTIRFENDENFKGID